MLHWRIEQQLVDASNVRRRHVGLLAILRRRGLEAVHEEGAQVQGLCGRDTGARSEPLLNVGKDGAGRCGGGGGGSGGLCRGCETRFLDEDVCKELFEHE